MSSCIQWLIIIIIIIIINEYYCSAVESNNPQEHLTTEKRKPTTVSRRLRTGVSSGVRTMGTGGGHCTPPKFRTCTPCTPQVKDAAYVKILSKRL